MTDEKILLNRARQLDTTALAEIYDACSPRLYRYAWRLLGDEATAEDCVAETFRRLLAALADGRGPRDYIQAYLYRTAHNWITDYYRRRPAAQDPLSDNLPDTRPSPSESAEVRLQQSRLRYALQELTPDQRQVLVLKYLEDSTNEEIAHSLGKPLTAVKALQHRALAALRKLLPAEEWLR